MKKIKLETVSSSSDVHGKERFSGTPKGCVPSSEYISAHLPFWRKKDAGVLLRRSAQKRSFWHVEGETFVQDNDPFLRYAHTTHT